MWAKLKSLFKPSLKAEDFAIGYSTPFEKAKIVLPKIWLDLKVFDNLDITKIDIKSIKTNNSLTPTLLLNEQIILNNHLKLARNIKEPNYLHIGYKHYDDWKFEDGKNIGSYVGKYGAAEEGEQQYAPAVTDFKLVRIIQRHKLGFFKYWLYRLIRKIK